MPYNTIVLIKQIIDIDQMKTNSATGEPITEGVPMRVENLSKNAIEAAVRIKEKFGGKITGIIFGGEQASSAMKEAYAIGVDEGIVIKGYRGRNPSVTARVLSDKIKTLQYDMVILGNQSADAYTGLLPGKISNLLNVPLLGNAVSIDPEDREVKVTRVLEDHNVVLKSAFPVVISVSQEINEPRLPAVLQIIKAGKREIKTETATLADPSSIKVLSDRAPKSERRKEIYEDAEKGIPALVRVIKEAMI
ncbi:MAG: electron transfer flavoprotein subunit beta/FixA family protein [Candidatus Thermoplasmatota archaeon]|nr:electron transfer flavoprotein subunit beta/FixA family protein [Candidatus Thermoplasmatota archaeon]